MFFALTLVAQLALRSVGGEPGSMRFLIVAGLLAALGLFAIVTWRFAVQESLGARWRERLFERMSARIANARYEDLAGVPMASLREILLTDVPFVARFYVELFGNLAVVAMWMAGLGAVLLWRGSALALALLALLIVFGLVMAVLLVAHMRLTGERFRRQAALSERARDLCELDRAVALRQFGLTETVRGQLLNDHDGAVSITLRQMKLAQAGRAALIALNGAGFLLLAFLGASLIEGGTLAEADLFAVLFLTIQLFTALTQLGQMTGQTAEAMTALRRIAVYWDDHEEDAEYILTGIHRIEARDVTFGYRGQKPVLKGMTFALRTGITALTGRTGAGKSTLALLLSGLLEPDEGIVAVDGSDGTVRAADLAPGRILYVGSKPVLFEGTLRDNLFADIDIGAHPLLTRLIALMREDGAAIDPDVPLIGPGGTGLSSGQGQIVGLMRAVLRDPPAIVFDEATSALDIRTEEAVQSALLAWCKERVTLVISHRECPWLARSDHRVTW